jgi:RHS repeat-associated protein
MSSAPTFFTHAGNFTSAVSGTVDPRSGLYCLNVSLGEVTGNRGLGPVLPLNLNYSPMSSIHTNREGDLGFGAGVSLGLSVYDVPTRILLLSNGARYKVLEQDIRQGQGNGPLKLDQTLLDTVIFEKCDDCYKIIYKSGHVEILMGPQKACTLKYPTQMLTPAGHALTFNWDYSKDPALLESITDDTITDGSPTVLLTFDSSKSVFEFFPGQAEGYTVTLTYTEEGDALNLLTGISNQSVEPSLDWTLKYGWVGDNQSWGKWLTSINAPGSATESVEYGWWDSYGHRFPNSANLPVLPAVYKHTQHVGAQQPDIETTYDYTENNFVGYRSGAQWSADRENLYDVIGDYEYGSTETCGTLATTRTYDKFHLQRSESVSVLNGTVPLTTRETRVDYYADYNTPFEQQEKYFQLPKTKTITWSRGSSNRSALTSYKWDDWGNVTTRTDPDGVVTSWSYYAGDQVDPDGHCPKDPNGFTRSIKSVTVDPTGFNKTSYSVQDAPVKQVNYRYVSATPVPGSAVNGLVLKSYESSTSDKLLLSETTFGYAQDSGNVGRLTNRTRTHHPNDGSGKSYVTTETFSCIDDSSLPNALLYTHSVSSYDKLAKSRTRSTSRFTNRVLRETNAQGVTNTYSYDGLGRMLERKLAAGSQYENSMTWEHIVTGGSNEAFQVITTDCNQNKRCRGLDGAGREVYEATNHVDAGIDEIKFQGTQQAYDAMGRALKTTHTDWLHDPATSYQRAGTISYDDFGQAYRVDYLDEGTYSIKRYDPIALTTTVSSGGTDSTTGSLETGLTVTTYDLSGNAVRVARYETDADVSSNTAYSCRTMIYDGLRRLRGKTDEAGNNTTYEYDAWDRVIKTTLPATTDVDEKRTPGTVFTHGYRSDSGAGDVIGIQANAVPLGSRQFDGFGRLTSATIGGRPWALYYPAGCDERPATVTAPDGVVRAHTYIAELDNRIHTLAAPSTNPSVSQDFEYSPVGFLSSATEGPSTRQYQQHASGRPKVQQTSFDDMAGSATYDQYTVGGKLYRYIHVDGTAQIIERNQWGQVSTIGDGTAKVTLHRDPAARLIGWTTEDQSGNGHSLDVQLTLDGYGRELSRTLLENGAQQWKITQTWNQKDLLTVRTTDYPASQSRKETFTYDECDRLIDWSCSGALPSDRYGIAMKEQKFYFDSFNNVTRVSTTFSDSSTNVATFTYGDSADPCKLISVANTHASYPPLATITYDAAGRITNDGMGHLFHYDALGRMDSVKGVSTGPSGEYAYDAHNRIFKQTVDGAKDPTYFYYKANELVNVIQGQPSQPDRNVRMLRSHAGCTSQYVESGGAGNVWLTGSQISDSVLVVANTGSDSEQFSYSPYGEDNSPASATVLGYTGQYRDPVLPGYQLGHGYRAYLPALMRFTAPDSMSPFGAGGPNPYAYCAGNPISYSDPTGHWWLTTWHRRISEAWAEFKGQLRDAWNGVKSGAESAWNGIKSASRSAWDYLFKRSTTDDGPVVDPEPDVPPPDVGAVKTPGSTSVNSGERSLHSEAKLIDALPAAADGSQLHLFKPMEPARAFGNAGDKLPRLIDTSWLDRDGILDRGAHENGSVRSAGDGDSEYSGEAQWDAESSGDEFIGLLGANDPASQHMDLHSSVESRAHPSAGLRHHAPGYFPASNPSSGHRQSQHEDWPAGT